MSSKLFAFNVSKKPEKAENQWIGDPVVHAGCVTSVIGYCTGNQNYGNAACDYCYGINNHCHAWGGMGYQICDGSQSDLCC